MNEQALLETLAAYPIGLERIMLPDVVRAADASVSYVSLEGRPNSTLSFGPKPGTKKRHAAIAALSCQH